MKPIKFEEMNSTAAEDQPEFLAMPMYRDDKQVISCWELSDEERVKVLLTGKIWMRLMLPEESLITPSLLEVDSPFTSDGSSIVSPEDIQVAVDLLRKAGLTIGVFT